MNAYTEAEYHAHAIILRHKSGRYRVIDRVNRTNLATFGTLERARDFVAADATGDQDRISALFQAEALS